MAGTKAAITGSCVLGLLAVSAAVSLVADPSRLKDRLTLSVEFEHVGMLQEGAKLILAGQAVGRIETLRPGKASGNFSGGNFSGGNFTDGEIKSAVHAEITIDRKAAKKVPANAQLFVGSKSAFGEVFIEIGPSLEEPDAQSLAQANRLVVISPPRMDKLLNQSFLNTMAFRQLVEQITPTVRELRKELDRFSQITAQWRMEPRQSSMLELQEQILLLAEAWPTESMQSFRTRWTASWPVISQRLAMLDQNTGHFIDEIRRIGQGLPKDISSRIDTVMADIAASQAQLSHLLGSIEQIQTLIASGRGTIGALLADPEFMDDAKGLGKILKRQPWKIFGRKPSDELPTQTDKEQE